MTNEIAELTLQHLSLVAIAIVQRGGHRHSSRYSHHTAGAAARFHHGAYGSLSNHSQPGAARFLIPVLGIGRGTAITALIVYALLPIVQNTAAGISGIDPAVRESAVAMGMTPMQLLRLIELPLAARFILAGIRIALVTTIGTATIAAAIGAGGLGVLIFRGLSMVDSSQILAGAIPAALLAILCEGV